MKNRVNNWLITQSEVAGAVAASVVYPDQTRISHVFSDAFASRTLDNVWQNSAQMAVALNALQISPPCVRWVFHDAWVYGCLRYDGICLVVLTEPELPPEKIETVETLLAEFQAL